MIDRLLEFIREYQTRVLEAASLFRQYKGVENPMYWRQAGLAQEGFLDPEDRIAYSFHGAGCWVTLSSGEVDWDFGHDGRLDGLDPWFLWCFAKEGTNGFPEFRDQRFLNATIDEAVSNGVIHRPFRALQDNLFYLRSLGAG